MGVIRSARTAVHLVTLLEEMPVQETLDGLAELRAAGLPLGAVVINQVRGSQLDDEQLRLAAERALPKRSEEGASCCSHRSHPPRCARWPDEAADHAARAALQNSERRRLAQTDQPILELPLLPGGIDLAALYGLSGGDDRTGLPG